MQIVKARKPRRQCKRDECIQPGKTMHVRRLGANGEDGVDSNFFVDCNRISQDELKRLQEVDASTCISRIFALLESFQKES